ncbi:MAG: hypothetical protein Q9162_001535 [Coniocarpon cinnabarinum]
MSQEQHTAADVDVDVETPPSNIFIPPSVSKSAVHAGTSYTHLSPLPTHLTTSPDTPCVLGIDEAGRGPVLGPMVYAVFYLPCELEEKLLTQTHHFDDSKALTPHIRSNLMRSLCSPGSDLHGSCGWATRVMSASDISAGMLRATGTYNLNNQAMDATIALIHDVCAAGVNVSDIYIDTIGKPEVYQKKLELVFPTKRITVAKKADSLYPCVSAASVCAKVTRDAALEVSYEAYEQKSGPEPGQQVESSMATKGWGSGYPSDARCKKWLERNMDPLFGWGPECRFSWDTAKSRLEGENACRVDWPEVEDEEDSMKVTSFFGATKGSKDVSDQRGEMANWFGRPATDVMS